MPKTDGQHVYRPVCAGTHAAFVNFMRSPATARPFGHSAVTAGGSAERVALASVRPASRLQAGHVSGPFGLKVGSSLNPEKFLSC